MAQYFLLMLAAYQALAVGSAFGQSGSDTQSNTVCIKHLEIPEYPSLPRQAHVPATETVFVFLSDGGSVERIESEVRSPRSTEQSKRLFSTATEYAIKHSSFQQTCVGKTVTLVFHFELVEDGPRDSFAFAYPNHFWVKVGPSIAMPERSDHTRRN